MKFVGSKEFQHLAKKSMAKGVGIRKAIGASAEVMPDRCVKFVISSPSVDRQADVVVQEGIDLSNYLKNPVVLWGHNQDEPPIGKCVSIGLEDGVMRAIVQFMPADYPIYGAKAEAIYRMACEGYVGATSIGFRPIEFKMTDDPERGAHDFDGGGCDFIRSELVEFSIVSVPCNPDALVEATPMPPAAEPISEPAPEAEAKSITRVNSSKKRMRMQMEYLRL